jgi:hypothetical protein
MLADLLQVSDAKLGWYHGEAHANLSSLATKRWGWEVLLFSAPISWEDWRICEETHE